MRPRLGLTLARTLLSRPRTLFPSAALPLTRFPHMQSVASPTLPSVLSTPRLFTHSTSTDHASHASSEMYKKKCAESLGHAIQQRDVRMVRYWLTNSTFDLSTIKLIDPIKKETLPCLLYITSRLQYYEKDSSAFGKTKEIATLLIAKSSKEDLNNITDSDYHNVLHLAAALKNKELIMQLLEKGASPLKKTPQGFLPQDFYTSDDEIGEAFAKYTEKAHQEDCEVVTTLKPRR